MGFALALVAVAVIRLPTMPLARFHSAWCSMDCREWLGLLNSHSWIFPDSATFGIPPSPVWRRGCVARRAEERIGKPRTAAPGVRGHAIPETLAVSWHMESRVVLSRLLHSLSIIRPPGVSFPTKVPGSTDSWQGSGTVGSAAIGVRTGARFCNESRPVLLQAKKANGRQMIDKSVLNRLRVSESGGCSPRRSLDRENRSGGRRHCIGW